MDRSIQQNPSKTWGEDGRNVKKTVGTLLRKFSALEWFLTLRKFYFFKAITGGVVIVEFEISHRASQSGCSSFTFVSLFLPLFVLLDI